MTLPAKSSKQLEDTAQVIGYLRQVARMLEVGRRLVPYDPWVQFTYDETGEICLVKFHLPLDPP